MQVIAVNIIEYFMIFTAFINLLYNYALFQKYIRIKTEDHKTLF